MKIANETKTDGETGCLHCGLVVPSRRLQTGNRFCCNGCEGVYELLREEGLDHYYELRQGAACPVPESRANGFAWLDREVHARRVGARPESRLDGPDSEPIRITLDIQGIHCAACVWLLEELFRREPGGLGIRINPMLGQAEIAWRGNRDELEGYLRAAERFGYRFGPATKGAHTGSRSLLIRLGLSIAATMNVMIFSLCYYLGLGPEDGRIYHVIGQAGFALGTIPVLVGGTVFIRSVMTGLRHRLIHLDLPIALGIVLAYSGSVYSYFRSGPEAAYFDTVAVFVTLMLLGRWIQERVLETNRSSLLENTGVDHLMTRRIVSTPESERVETLSASEILAGDRLLVVPGDLSPVAGALESEAGMVSLDWITGESAPVALVREDSVPAGAFNTGQQALQIVSDESFGDSRLHQLLVQQSRVPAGESNQQGALAWWRRVSLFYVFSVLSLAGLAFGLWVGRDVSRAIEITVAMLVVTCPCAIGLALPLARETALNQLKRRGIFVRTAAFLDRALQVRKILFDKTGTLTLGRLELDSTSVGVLSRLEGSVAGVLHTLVIRSNHPVSRAIAEQLESVDRTDSDSGIHGGIGSNPDDIAEIPGHGMEWWTGADCFRLGRPSFAGSRSSGADPVASYEGQTLFTRNGEVLADLRFEEQLRDDVRSEIQALRSRGFEIHLLSGDIERKAEMAGQIAGISKQNCRGGLTPEAKAAIVRSLDDSDTLMIGDGINDSLSFDEALLSATPAIDMPTLPARADFFFLGSGISAVRESLATATRLQSTTKQVLATAVAYNLCVVVLTLLGRVTPVSAAIVMPIGSIGLVLLTIYLMSRSSVLDAPNVGESGDPASRFEPEPARNAVARVSAKGPALEGGR